MPTKINGSSHQDLPKTFSEAFLRLIWGKRWAPYIIVLVVIASAIVAIWTVFKPSLPPRAQDRSPSSVTPIDSMPSERGDANSDYTIVPKTQDVVPVTTRFHNPEKLAATWLSAIKERKTDTLVALSSTPFYAPSGEVYLTEDDLRDFYDSITSSMKGDWDEMKIYAYKVNLLIDLSKQKKTLGKKTLRYLNMMSIRSDDIQVFFWVGNEGSSRSGVSLFSRWFDGELRVIGVIFY